MKRVRQILIAEDNLADLKLIKSAFEEINLYAEITIVKDGQELLDFFENDNIENLGLVLLDLNLPKVDGMDILKKFYTDDVLKKIVKLQLGKIEKRIANNHDAKFTYDDSVVDTVASRCTDVDSGARNVINILMGTLLPEMSGEVLSRMATGEGISKVNVSVGDDENFVYEIV